MPIRYTRVGWQDAPSTETPIDAANLNHMDNGILAISQELDTELDSIRDEFVALEQDTSSQIDSFKEETSTKIDKFSSDITTMQNGLPGMISDKMDDKFGQEIGDNVTSWLTEHVDPAGSAVVVDDTLTIQGAAADAKKTGDEISGLKEDLGEPYIEYDPVTISIVNEMAFTNRLVGQEMGFVANAMYHYTVLDVTPGESYKVQTYFNNSGNNKYYVYFVDSNDLIIARDQLDTGRSGLETFVEEVPTNASKMYLQCYSNTTYVASRFFVWKEELTAFREKIDSNNNALISKTNELSSDNFVRYDIKKLVTNPLKYVDSTGSLANDSSSVAYRFWDVSDTNKVKIENMWLNTSRCFVGIADDGTVTVILTAQGSGYVSGIYDVSGYKYLSFTGKSDLVPTIYKYNPIDVHQTNRYREEKRFNLYDYTEVSAIDQRDTSTVLYASTYDDDEHLYADKDFSVALVGESTTAGSTTRHPELRIKMNSQVSLAGVQGFKIPVYIENAENLTFFYFGIYKTGETSPSWFRQITTGFKEGWNLIEFPAVAYLNGITTWTAIDTLRFIIHTENGFVRVFIGDVILVKPAKAKVIFICDHGYKNFMDVAYPQLKEIGVPVTWTMKLSMLGQSVEYASRILTQEEIDTLAEDYMSDINIHSATAIPTKDATADETKADVWKGLYYLRSHGYSTPIPYRAAWWNNNAPHAPETEDMLEVSATYDGNDNKITVFPFSDPHNVPRCVVHTLSNDRIDTIFDNLEKTHGTVLMYTHDLSDETVPSGTNRININSTEFAYLLGKLESAIDDGWLEGTTIRQLYTRYAL